MVWWLLGQFRPEAGSRQARQTAFAIFAWNPLVLFDLVGNSHNDTAMLLLMLLGIGLVAGERPVTGFVGAGVECAGEIRVGDRRAFLGSGLGRTGVDHPAGHAPSRRDQCDRPGPDPGAGLAMVANPPARSARSNGPPASRLVLNSAPDLLALTIADTILVPFGVDRDLAQANVRLWVRAVAWTTFVAYLGFELWRLWRCSRHSHSAPESLLGATRATARALLVLPLLVLTWVWSWYFSWSLAVVVLLGWRSWLTRLVVVYTLVGLPIVYAHQYLNQDLSGVFVLLFAVGPLAVWLVWVTLGRWLHLNNPLPGADDLDRGPVPIGNQ